MADEIVAGCACYFPTITKLDAEGMWQHSGQAPVRLCLPIAIHHDFGPAPPLDTRFSAASDWLSSIRFAVDSPLGVWQ